MVENVVILLLAALAVAAVVSSVVAVLRDGYRRVPTTRIRPEYQRDEHYRP